MKKLLSLLLAAVMALALCVTAFAGGSMGTRVYLTGDAADEVTGLTSGQRVDAGGSATVRLNVLNDPSAEEYTVTLDGKTLKADHSTAQYHVYSLPADKLTARTATLSVNSSVSTHADETGATVTVQVGSYSQEVTLTADKGGTTSAPNLEDVTLPSYDGSFQRIYVNVPEGVTVGTEAKKAGRNFKLIGANNFVMVEGKGKTTADLYFYNTPNSSARTKSVAFSYAVDGKTYYYTLNIVCPAAPKYALGPGYYKASGSTPESISANIAYTEMHPHHDGISTDGHVFKYADGKYAGWARYLATDPAASEIYAALAVYTDGAVPQMAYDADTQSFPKLAEPDWAALAEASHGLYGAKVADESGVLKTTISFNRPGFYWFPVAYTYDGTPLTGMLPMEMSATAAAVSDYLNAANAVKDSVANEGAKALLDGAIETVTNAQGDLASAVYVAGDDYTYTVPTDNTLKELNTARTYYGAPITGAALVEKELNILQDVTALWNKNDAQRDNRLTAYMSIMNMDRGVHAAIDIKSSTDRDLYQQIRQAKWDLLQAEDLNGINKVLTGLSLPAIGETEPEVMLGDINGDSKINSTDAGLLIVYCNGGTLTDDQLKAADLNGDGDVNSTDAGLLILYCNGIIDKFPAAQ